MKEREREIKVKTQDFWHGQSGRWGVIHHDREFGAVKGLPSWCVWFDMPAGASKWICAINIWIYSVGLEFRQEN